jgi:uncharacterized protein
MKKEKAVDTTVWRIGRGIAGLGMFASVDIKKGQYIIEYTGEYLTNKEAEKRGGRYLFEIDENTTIDGSMRENKARYLNHACKPNVEAVIEDGKIFFYSKRVIKKNEELTFDYGKEYFKVYIEPYGCRCSHCLK